MTDLATLEREAEAAERRAVALRKFLEVARELGEEGLAEVVALVSPPQANGDGHSKSNGQKPEPLQPSGRAAIRIIVKERPGIWTLADLRQAMIDREWFTSDKGVEAAASRLCRLNHEGRRIGPGRYVFPADYGEEDTSEMTPSDGAMIPLDT